jgi:hypothetical protein
VSPPQPLAGTVSIALGAEACRVHIRGPMHTIVLAMGIGTATVARVFQRDPPREGDLESAIEQIEQCVMPLVRQWPANAVLVAADAQATGWIARSTGSDRSETASLQAVEAYYQSLALAAHRGAWPRGMELDPTDSAALLILREFMHHGGFSAMHRLPREDHYSPQ